MTRRFFVFESVDRFTCGTVGEPGNRTFFLQAVLGPRVVSVQLEKVQVAALAQRMGQVLTDIDGHGALLEQANAPDDERGLDEPLRDEFSVGTLTIGWDAAGPAMLIEARSRDEPGADEEEDEEEIADEAPEGPDVMRVRLAADQAAAFVRRAARVLAAGRPPCPICGQPLNPEGHICPRKNGYVH
jgi:uncharacterized repeat protein (TIGR03847 family)